VAHQRLQRNNVTAALAQEAIREAVPELVRREVPDSCTPADTPEHPHELLTAGRPLWIEPAPLALESGYPLFDFDSQHVIAQFRLAADGRTRDRHADGGDLQG
jgi:hypothetical protein